MVLIPLATAAWSYAMPAPHVETTQSVTALALESAVATSLTGASADDVARTNALAQEKAVGLLPRWNAALSVLAQQTGVWERWLALLWLAMSASLFVRVLKEVRRVRRLPQVLPTRVIAGTEVRVSDSVGPAAIGGRTPCIVLPAWVLDMDETLVDLVVRHEREHLNAGDTRLLMLGLGWLVLMPWHLPLWWAWGRLRLAIEVDCDTRVLRRGGSPRSYAQLLLFITQRQGSVRMQESLAGPLLLAFNPQRHHLERRISAMTARSSKHPVRLAFVTAGIAVTATLAAAIPAPTVVGRAAVENSSSRTESPAVALPAILRVHKLGLAVAGTTLSAGAPMEIVIYGQGTVRLGIGLAALTELRDTVRLNHLPAFSADVTNGEVHVEMRRVAGSLELAGDATGAAMKSFTVTGRHIVLERGGAGVRALPAQSGDGDNARPQSQRVSQVNEREFRLADSIAARRVPLELTRAKLVARYSPEFQKTRDVEGKLSALEQVAAGLQPAAKRRVIDAVIRTLEERRDGLELERRQLLLNYEASSPMVTDVVKEQAAIDVRRKELGARTTSAPAR
jgi:beta-lactamase regulating signal transducer with metallopeptidase domain